jgi:1-deoxy-D-xylulose-5-phosphate reductoisomerase
MDWNVPRRFDFEPPDLRKFPLLKLAYQAQETGGSAGCTLNAADEIAVEAFLAGRVTYPGIAEVVEHTLSRVPVSEPRSIEEVLQIDEESRSVARAFVARRAGADTVGPLVRA